MPRFCRLSSQVYNMYCCACGESLQPDRAKRFLQVVVQLVCQGLLDWLIPLEMYCSGESQTRGAA